MQRAQPSRLSSLHIVVSSIAALAGVGIAGYQAFTPSTPQQPAPVQVTVALEPPKVVESMAIKADAEQSAVAASYSAALKDGSELRYRFADLFDGNPSTYVTVMEPDNEINVLVNFGSSANQVSEIEYVPPPGIDPILLATVADVMVLPDGGMGASGRPVTSFRLPVAGGRQTFALAGPELGKGLWLRVAGGKVIGDFIIRRGARHQ